MGLNAKRNWGALLEATAVFIAILAYIWWIRLAHPWAWMPILGFVISSHFLRGESAGRLGFGWRNFKTSFGFVFVWSTLITAALVTLGTAFGTIRVMRPGQLAAGILAYMVWGLFQQYVLNGYFVNRFLEFSGEPRGSFVPLLAATAFALAHLPNWFLVAVTFTGGYVSARVYLRFRSLYPLAIAHGIIAFFLLMITPESIATGFLVGPRYVLEKYGTYPEFLLF